jgi:hypothetical protein
MSREEIAPRYPALEGGVGVGEPMNELKYLTRSIAPRYPPQRGGLGGEKSLPSGEGFRVGRTKSLILNVLSVFLWLGAQFTELSKITHEFNVVHRLQRHIATAPVLEPGFGNWGEVRVSASLVSCARLFAPGRVRRLLGLRAVLGT